MKKSIKILSIVIMLFIGLFVLTGCGGKKDTNNKEIGNSGENGVVMEQQNQNDNMSEEEKLLSKVGLELSQITPNEEYYRMEYDADDKEFTFYMEKGTERNIGEYAHKVYNACKEVATDNKIYKANFNFYMNDGSAEEYTLKTVEEINSGITYMFLDQFGYYFGGETISITYAAVTDMDGERNDDIYYPVYTVSFGW